MLPAGAAEGQLPAGIAGAKEKTNQGGWFYFTLPNTNTVCSTTAISRNPLTVAPLWKYYVKKKKIAKRNSQ